MLTRIEGDEVVRQMMVREGRSKRVVGEKKRKKRKKWKKEGRGGGRTAREEKKKDASGKGLESEVFGVQSADAKPEVTGEEEKEKGRKEDEVMMMMMMMMTWGRGRGRGGRQGTSWW